MSGESIRCDTYSLSADRRFLVSYPADTSAAESDEFGEWVRLIVRKVARQAALPPALVGEPTGGAYAAAAMAVKEMFERAETATGGAVLDDPEADLPDPGPYPAVPATDATQPDDEASDREESAAHRELHAPKGAKEKGRQNRIAVLRVLSECGPMRIKDIARGTGIPYGTVGGIMVDGLDRGVWRKANPATPLTSPYEITDAGRAYLTEAGFVAAPAPVPKPAPAPAPSHEVGGTLPAPRPKPAPVADVDRGRCALVAEAMVRLAIPVAALSIGAESGLDCDDVEKRLKAHPEWFEKVGQNGAGDTYRLTEAGKALAAEADE